MLEQVDVMYIIISLFPNMTAMNPCVFYKCLADDAGLKTVLLLARVKEACVCDLMAALKLDQPRASRHLAQLRSKGVLYSERRGKRVFYRLHPELPQWAWDVVLETIRHNSDYFSSALLVLADSQALCGPER